MAVAIVLVGLLVVGCLALSLLGDAKRMQPLINGKTLLRAWLPSNTPLKLTPLGGPQIAPIFKNQKLLDCPSRSMTAARLMRRAVRPLDLARRYQ
jgi:hypothetical protein